MKTTVEQHLYERLLRQPLFQGMSRSDMEQIISGTKIEFCIFKKNQTIAAENAPCVKLFFLLDGSVEARSYSDDHGYVFSEPSSCPYMLQPERMFGLSQHYTKTFIATSACEFLAIHKNEIARLSSQFMIFRINLLNIVSTQSQKLSRLAWHVAATPRQRITRFFLDRCSCPSGPKTVRIKIVRLAEEINDNRVTVSRELNAMQSEGLLTFSRGVIHIPALEKLAMQKP